MNLWTVGCADPRLTAPARSPMDKPGKTLCVSPHLAHRSAAAHKLHSTPHQDGMNLISGNRETSSRLPAFSLFLPGSCPNNRDRRTAPARWRGSGRIQKRSVEHASHRRGPTSDSAILSELARCYCLHTARAQAACQGVDRQLTKTTGLHRTMAKVCKSDGQGTFAGTQGNGEVAPIPIVCVTK